MKRKHNPVSRLRSMMSMVECDSQANGNLLIDPRWRRKIGKPGVLTRMAAANDVAAIINQALRKA